MRRIKWKDIYAQNFIMMATFLRFVTSQCSETHRQACSFPFIQLQAISAAITPSEKYVPDYNETTLRNVCNWYTDYINCSKPFLPTCNTQTVSQIQTYDITLGLICKDLFNGYLSNRNCYDRLKSSYQSCKDKELATVKKMDQSVSAYTYILCSASRKYALCVYTATALGCSMSAADVYFKLLNHTISSVFEINSYQCTLRHPMDEISIYTTSPSTASAAWSAQTTMDNTRDKQKHYKEVSCSVCVRAFSLLTYIIVLYLTTFM
ncbi:uncharacterized protein LOC132716248 [Ruditapes philippinarum]|uniref:uncharacterized protein LOC132716248 n=1 Tax=Ruditapes philippinarum TaxID=129788 RepID=UPI00295ABA6D|nr:uncharacterized protein LOC132716248 [Ruditapes philippinarum]